MKEARAKATEVRKALSRALALLDAGATDDAYAAAEEAQHAAYDLKMIIGDSVVGATTPQGWEHSDEDTVNGTVGS